MSYQQIVANFSGIIRRDTIADREYLVAPMAMIGEGVVSGSNGPLFYPEAELKKTAKVWNHKPIVVYHPKKDGEHVSACSPDMLTEHQVGIIMNSRWDDDAKKLRAEAWLEEKRLQTVDNRVYEDLKANKVVEVSTGLFTQNHEEPGVWNSASGPKEYTTVAKDYQPDHLAILPDEVGAFSVADGGGLLQTNEALKKTQEAIGAFVLNEVSHDQLRDKLWSMVRKEHGEAWISEVYEDYIIYELGGKLYRQPYSMEGDEPKLGSDSEKVERHVEYRPATAIANSQGSTEDTEMTKAQMVDALIANKASGFTEKDKTALLARSEESVKVLHANTEKATKAPEQTPKPDDKKGEGEGQEGKRTTQTKEGEQGDDASKVANEAIKRMEANNAKKATSVEEYLKDAPPAVKRIIANSLRTEKAARQRLISTIVANAGEDFTEAELTSNKADGEPVFDTETLEKLAKLSTRNAGAEDFSQNYAGAGFPSQEDFSANAAGIGDDDGLDLPSTRPTVNEDA